MSDGDAIVGSDKLEASYHYALGRFMHNFALLEVCINDLVTSQIMDEVDPGFEKLHIIKASLGGMRFAPARDALKRLLRITQPDEAVRSEVDRLLAHIGEIHFLRDRLAHNAAGTTQFDGEWWFGCTNRVNVREFDDVEVLYFTVDMIHHAADDIAYAQFLLVRTLDPIQGAIDKHAKTIHPDYIPYVSRPPRPWLYKPSQLKRGGPKSQRNRSAPKRPPEPSPP